MFLGTSYEVTAAVRMEDFNSSTDGIEMSDSIDT